MYTREGKRIHDLIAQKKLKLLPMIKDTAIFEDYDKGINAWTGKTGNPVQVNEWLEMSMIADVLDPKEKLLIDWKSGSRKSTEHNKLQLYVYAYLLSILPEPIEITTGIMAKVEESTEGVITCTDFSLYKINQEKLEYAENYIESNASEIYNNLYGTN